MTRTSAMGESGGEGIQMAENTTRSSGLRSQFDDIQAHYDISDDFFGLFQDPSRTYSCAYFEPPELTLEQAQTAKVDLNLDKLDLQPGMTLLDIGCGWGSTMKRALEKYDVNVVGLTLSKNQHLHTEQLLSTVETDRSYRVLLGGWEHFTEPVHRIVSIEAFEHFGHENYDGFFRNSYDILPEDGRMMIQSSASYHPYNMHARGKEITFEGLKFIKFMVTEIFPGGRLPTSEMMVEHGERGGFTVAENLSLRPHYIKTLSMWADTLEANRELALELQSEEVYNRYMRYLRGCEHYFRDEMLDVRLVAYTKGAG